MVSRIDEWFLEIRTHWRRRQQHARLSLSNSEGPKTFGRIKPQLMLGTLNSPED
jgi:hypothetical protein